MASVWVHDQKRLDKVRGHLPVKTATNLMEEMIREWCGKGGTHKRVDKMEALLYDKHGKLRCGLYVEKFSPPTAAERGQPKRETSS